MVTNSRSHQKALENYTIKFAPKPTAEPPQFRLITRENGRSVIQSFFPLEKDKHDILWEKQKRQAMPFLSQHLRQAHKDGKVIVSM